MIKIDQGRGLQRSLAFPPLEGDLRVSILVRAQTMAAPAANALLKTLEEPPPGNLLVLTAEENEPLLPTILSRCQVVPFAALSDRLVTTILGRGDEDEEDEAAAAELARLAAGSPGLARKLARGRMPELLAETTAAITQGGGPARMFSLAERCARLKDDLPILLQGLYAWTADLARHACGQGHRAGVPLTEEEKALADRLGPAAAAALLSEIDRARGLVARNCNRQAVCELLFMRMASGS
jgi:DNA polymerase-3 subunit delta'